MNNLNFREMDETTAETHVKEALNMMDEERLNELMEFKKVQSLKTEILQREMKRRADSHGTSDPRVKQIAERIAYDKKMIAALDIHVEAAKDATKEGSSTQPGASTQPGSATQPNADIWIVRGTVTDQNDKPLKGLIVSLYDEDLLFDDYLGTKLTDEQGNFEIIYRTGAFRDLFEKSPDIYLKILDSSGKHIYSTKKAVRPSAGREEKFMIKINIGKIE